MAALTLILTIAAGACARKADTEFDPSAVDRLVPEQSTLADATKLLGPPARTRAFAGGKVLMRWIYVRMGESAAIDIMFGDNGKMISIVRGR
jgi:hypothetical protein